MASKAQPEGLEGIIAAAVAAALAQVGGLPAEPEAEATVEAPAAEGSKAHVSTGAKGHRRGVYDTTGGETRTHMKRRLSRTLFGKAKNELSKAQLKKLDVAFEAEWKATHAPKPKASTTASKPKASSKRAATTRGPKAGAQSKTAATDGHGNPATANGKAVRKGTKAHPYPLKANAVRMANAKGVPMYYLDGEAVVKYLPTAKPKASKGR